MTNLPDTLLVKKALLKNIELRTNWIITIEKLVSALNVADKIEDFPKFKEAVKRAIKDRFLDYWTNSLNDPTLSRLTRR